MKFCAVILGAGRSKRMRSSKPKVLHEISGKPVIQYTIDALKALKPEKLVIVVGNKADEVKKKIKNNSVSFVTQDKLLGTGDALLQAKRKLNRVKDTIVVLNGDSPLIQSRTLKDFLERHEHDKNDISLLSFVNDSLSGYGRIKRNEQGDVTGIIEDKHASSLEKKECRELNGGVYALEAHTMKYLNNLKKNASSGEYYLTDIVSIAFQNGCKLEAYTCPSEEVAGINTRAELYQAEGILNQRNISKCLSGGVTFINPSATTVHSPVSIGRDTVVYPNTCLEGNTSIGRDCIIYPGVRIVDSVIGNNVQVKDCSLIERSKIKGSSTIGPFSYIRDNSRLKTQGE